MNFKSLPLLRGRLQRAFVIAAKEMPLRAKNIDNIMASSLTKGFLAHVPTDVYFYVPRKLEAPFLLPAKISVLLAMDKSMTLHLQKAGLGIVVSNFCYGFARGN